MQLTNTFPGKMFYRWNVPLTRRRWHIVYIESWHAVAVAAVSVQLFCIWASFLMSIILSLTQQFSTNAGHCCRLQVSRTCVGRKTVSLQSIRRNFTKMQNDSLNLQQKGNQIKTFVVCGPSGSGKTTLLDMVTSFYKDCFKFCVSRKLIFRSPMGY